MFTVCYKKIVLLSIANDPAHDILVGGGGGTP